MSAIITATVGSLAILVSMFFACAVGYLGGKVEGKSMDRNGARRSAGIYMAAAFCFAVAGILLLLIRS